MPLPKGTRYRVKTIIRDGIKKKIRLAFNKKGDVIEHKKLTKKNNKWKSKD